METVRPVEYTNGRLCLIDQRRLPAELVRRECPTYEDVAEAIEDMTVRGAPAIGITAAYGLAIGAYALATGASFGRPGVPGGGTGAEATELYLASLEGIAERFKRTRPTAVNLFWAIHRLMKVAEAQASRGPIGISVALLEEAKAIADEDVAANHRMGDHGRDLIPGGATVLTHCNAGALATGGFGTALGVIRAAVAQGKKIEVLADETRPLFQGARLTAWELAQDGIPVTVITDNMSGYMMQKKRVDVCIVGADRIARNGDTANKIGTYSLAVLAQAHGLPFYVAAPASTIDMGLADGSGIVIEERKAEEVTTIGGTIVAPPGVKVANPAFDVTPARLITAIITDRGVVRQPLADNLEALFGKGAEGAR
ncbi:MAG TPA: S-methyl-5-thioribose-1-phosphate isomerase [Bacillota bacterium]|jgi:methylthioribose-1-phosphate isomerase